MGGIIMKKRSKVIFLWAIILIVGISYILYLSNRINTNNTINQDIKIQKIFKSQNEIYTEHLTLLEQYSIDIDRDNDKEEVKLYTAATKDSNGEIMWDDGQNWLLLVKDSDGEFILFDGYVQLGELQIWIYTADEDNEMHITTLQPGSASMNMCDYVFVKDKQYFERKVIFDPQNVNMLSNTCLLPK